MKILLLCDTHALFRLPTDIISYLHHLVISHCWFGWHRRGDGAIQTDTAGIED